MTLFNLIPDIAKQFKTEYSQEYMNFLAPWLDAYKDKPEALLSNTDFLRDMNHYKSVAENYLTFVDKGVSGTEKKHATPYSYRTKYPPIQAIKQWTRLKGMPEEAAYGIQRNIFRFGMKPTNVIKIVIDIAFKAAILSFPVIAFELH